MTRGEATKEMEGGGGLEEEEEVIQNLLTRVRIPEEETRERLG